MKDINSLDLESLFATLTADGSLLRLIQLARDEDLGATVAPGDVTSASCIEATRQGAGRIVAREDGVLAGVRALGATVRAFAPDVTAAVRAADGRPIAAGTVIAELSGPLRQILAAERTLLNLLGRLSGVATRTAAFVHAVEGTGAAVYDTRKTTPGLRSLEKYAVRCGGGRCHRLGLYDAVLIKDNHLAGVDPSRIAGFVRDAAARARAMASPSADGKGLRFVEVEVDSLDQLDRIFAAEGCGVDIVLLDNFDLGSLRAAVGLREKWNLAAKVQLESSGGVTLDSVRAAAETGVDRISVGSLTHGATWLDVSLDVEG